MNLSRYSFANANSTLNAMRLGAGARDNYLIVGPPATGKNTLVKEIFAARGGGIIVRADRGIVSALKGIAVPVRGPLAFDNVDFRWIAQSPERRDELLRVLMFPALTFRRGRALKRIDLPAQRIVISHALPENPLITGFFKVIELRNGEAGPREITRPQEPRPLDTIPMTRAAIRRATVAGRRLYFIDPETQRPRWINAEVFLARKPGPDPFDELARVFPDATGNLYVAPAF